MDETDFSFFIEWACSITLGNTTRFIHIVGSFVQRGLMVLDLHRPFTIVQLLLFHISTVHDSAMYLLQSVKGG